jgi:hypothetical protein
MLNKKVCRKCIEVQGRKWSQIRKRLWKLGVIECPEVLCSVFITHDPPDACPYCLEHVLHEDIPPEEIRKCQVDGCNEEPHAKGYCKQHYYKNVFKRNPNERFCSIEGCEGQFHAKGLCKKHYRNIKQ